ncbi:MAG: nucleotide-binding protein [Deltaproteobacteria bacterium]|nr:nucleotide-binding protein [Deltaproteobacteria bacterium]
MDEAKVKKLREQFERDQHRAVRKALDGCPVVSRVSAGREAVVSRLVADGALEVHGSAVTLCAQGDPSDCVYFVLAGQVGIFNNGSVIARREPVELVGEMSLLAHSPKRSATMKTLEPTAVWKLAGPTFETIADEHPALWRGVGLRLSERLRERDWMVPSENATPKVFFGSSGEYAAALDPLSNAMRSAGAVFDHIDWRTAFRGGDLTLERLVDVAADVDFAVLILSPDDVLRSRKKQSAAPRDNVVFEAGLFMGNVGRERVLPLVPANLKPKLPSDWQSWNWIEFDTTREGDPAAASKIAERIRSLGVRPRFPKDKPARLKKT